MSRAGRSTALVPALALALTALLATAPILAQAGNDRGPAASLLAAAERRARDGDLRGAIGDYEQLIQQFPESPQAPEAMLRIAQGQLAGDDRTSALATVARLVTTYPGAPQSAGGLVLEGTIRSERPAEAEDLDEARKTLEKAWLLFPRTAYPVLPARSAARVLDGELALRLQQDDQATTSFLEVLEMEPLSPATADAHIGLGTAFVRMGEWQAAAESLQDALGVPGITAESAARARRRLELLERRLLRSATGTDLWSGARRMTIAGAQFRRLSGVAVDDRGGMALIDSGADEALRVSAEGTVEKRWTLRNGEKPSWGAGSTIQVAARDSVIVPGEAVKSLTVPGKDKQLDGIRAVERGPFGRWIVLATRSEGVLSYPDGRGSGRPVLRGDGDPVDLAMDALDQLYVLEKKERRVLRINLRTDERETVVRGAWKQAAAVAVDPFGYLHVLDAGDGRIHTYDRSGTEVGAVGPILPGGVDLSKAEDLSASGDGRLYLAAGRDGLIVLE